MGLRVIESIPVDRAKQRATLAYDALPNLRVGLEANPKDDDYGPLVNWRVFDETQDLPAIVLGTSTDRIGTPSGRAVYATASKDLERWIDLPIAPYIGVNYSGFDHDFHLIGGINARYPNSFTSTHFYDGENIHHLLSHQFQNGMTLGVLRAEQETDAFWGLTYGTSF